MGDRATAEIVTKNGSIFVYTHNFGRQLPEMARNAMTQARDRKHDDSYATRIIVDQLTKEGRDRELGFGLSLKPMEDEYNGDRPSVVINIPLWKLTVFGRRACVMQD